MELRTTRGEIRTVADRWAKQYRGPHWSKDPEKVEIGKRLRELDPEKATPKDVARVVGNDSWTDLGCDECGKDRGVLVSLGDPDRVERSVDLCPVCLKKALALAASPPDDRGRTTANEEER